MFWPRQLQILLLRLFAISLYLLLALSSFAFEASLYAGDDAMLRRELAQALAAGSWEENVQKLAGEKKLASGDSVRVEYAAKEAGRARLLMRPWKHGELVPYPAGSWDFTINTGKIEAARYFPREDSEIWLEFIVRPGDIVHISLRLYGAWPVWRRQLPLRPADILQLPLDRLLARLDKIIPYDLIEIYPEDYAELRHFDRLLRQQLPLRYAEDGAIDEKGRAVFIKDGSLQGERPGLNCSGFVKWVVDGVIAGNGGRATSIGELKKAPLPRGHGLSEVWEGRLNPWFGLDWVRNLAIRAASLADTQGRPPLVDEYEVASAPFALLDQHLFNPRERDSGKGPLPWPGFYENSGFPVEGLAALLYSLSARDSNSFWLVSMNDTPKGGLQRQHSHVAVLVPHFSETGGFRISVFESGSATDFSRFVRRYLGWNAYLARVSLAPDFLPSDSQAFIDSGMNLWRGGIKR